MARRELAIWITALSAAVGVLRPLMVWDQLPPYVASHFSADGTPDGMSGKMEFFLIYALIMGVVVAALVGSTALIGKLPARLINLPHKEYWLQAGRLDQARDKLSDAMWWMCAATMALSTGTLELVLRANVARSPLNNGMMWTLMGLYMAFSVAWTMKLLTAFTPPDEN